MNITRKVFVTFNDVNRLWHANEEAFLIRENAIANAEFQASIDNTIKEIRVYRRNGSYNFSIQVNEG